MEVTQQQTGHDPAAGFGVNGKPDLWIGGEGGLNKPVHVAILAKDRSAVDAFYAPVAFRVQTYGLALDATADAYAKRLLGLESMKAWYADGIKETIRDLPHEEETVRMGTVLQDLRAR